MTRLKTEWITYMLDGMKDYNRELQKKTGTDLSGLIMRTFGVSQEEYEASKESHRAAVIPVTQGEGIIGSFSESVAAITESAGFETVVTEHTDIDGIYDAVRSGCDILFFADDSRYLAMNIRQGKISDNNYATALGFVEILSAMAEKYGKNLKEEKLLQIGCGIVGKEAAEILTSRGIPFYLYDKNPDAVSKLTDFSGRVISDRAEIRNYPFVLDFTNEGGWLHRENLLEDVLYASPGVPYSIDTDAAPCFEGRSVHDNLEIGTAIMLGEVLFGK